VMGGSGTGTTEHPCLEFWIGWFREPDRQEGLAKIVSIDCAFHRAVHAYLQAGARLVCRGA
jgi:hypothetical protein